MKKLRFNLIPILVSCGLAQLSAAFYVISPAATAILRSGFYCQGQTQSEPNFEDARRFELGRVSISRYCQRGLNAATNTHAFELSLSDTDGNFEDSAPIRVNPLIPAERYTTADWWKCLISLPRSQMLGRVSSHLIANTVFAIMVWAAYVLWPKQLRFLTAGLTPQHHLLLGNALGLLLIFRTNTAYDRFWEGRRLWGFMGGRVREVRTSNESLPSRATAPLTQCEPLSQLARLGHSSLRGLDREHFLQLVAALPPVLLQHLQSGWKGATDENLKRQARQLEELVPKVARGNLAHGPKGLPPRRAPRAGAGPEFTCTDVCASGYVHVNGCVRAHVRRPLFFFRIAGPFAHPPARWKLFRKISNASITQSSCITSTHG